MMMLVPTAIAADVFTIIKLCMDIYCSTYQIQYILNNMSCKGDGKITSEDSWTLSKCRLTGRVITSAPSNTCIVASCMHNSCLYKRNT